MSDPIKVQFICPAEREVIGTLAVEPGETVTAEMIREYMDGAEGWREEARALRASVADNSYMMCPRCESMIMLGLDGQEMDAVIEDRFVVLVGAFSYPDPQHPHSER